MKYAGWVFKANGDHDNDTINSPMKYSNWVLRDRPSNRVFKLVNKGKYYQRYWLNHKGNFMDMGGTEWYNFEIDTLIKDGTWVVDKDHYLNQFADAVSRS